MTDTTPTKNESLPVLTLLDQCFDIEIQRVSTVEFNSNSICRTFYRELRKSLEAALTREAPTEGVDVEALRAIVRSWEGGQSAVESMAQFAATMGQATPPAPQRMAQREPVGWLNPEGSYLAHDKRERMIEAGEREGASVGEITFGKIAKAHDEPVFKAVRHD